MKPQNIRPIVWKVFFLLWSLMALVIFMYFPGALSQIHDATLYDFPILGDKLSRIDLAAFLLDTLKSVFGLVFYGISCLSVGMKLSAVLHLQDDEEFDSDSLRGALLPTCFLIGNAIFSLLFLALASLSRLSSLHTMIILSLGLFLGLGEYRKFSISAIRTSTGYERVILAFCLAILAAALFQSSARISYDASSTYFSYAKLTALDGHVAYYVDTTFVVSFLHSTIIYSSIIQIFGDQSARMISWLLGAATIPFGLALARHTGISRQARRILPVLILTSTAFVDLMGDGKLDLFSSAYALAAVYWFLKANVVPQTQTRAKFILSGCLVGFACILRPQNTFLLGMFVLLYAFQQWQAGRSTVIQLVRQAGWMMVGAGGFAFYHFAINMVILGSPFAFISVFAQINPSDGPWDYNPNIVWIYRLLYPFVVTFKNSGASLGNISPLVLAFLPALAMTEIRRRYAITRDTAQVYITTSLVLLAWILIFFMVVEVRYVFFLWIILFIPSAEWIAGLLESRSTVIRRISLVWIVAIMSYILIRSLFISISTYSPIDKQGNPHCSDNALCNQVASINKIAGPGDRVLVLSSFRYYLRTDLFACSTNEVEYDSLKKFTHQDSEMFWREVHRLGYKYITYEKGYATDFVLLKFIPSPDNAPEWIHLVSIFEEPDDLQVAYRIDVSEPPIQVEKTCTKNNISGIWEVGPTTP